MSWTGSRITHRHLSKSELYLQKIRAVWEGPCFPSGELREEEDEQGVGELWEQGPGLWHQSQHLRRALHWKWLTENPPHALDGFLEWWLSYLAADTVPGIPPTNPSCFFGSRSKQKPKRFSFKACNYVCLFKYAFVLQCWQRIFWQKRKYCVIISNIYRNVLNLTNLW